MFAVRYNVYIYTYIYNICKGKYIIKIYFPFDKYSRVSTFIFDREDGRSDLSAACEVSPAGRYQRCTSVVIRTGRRKAHVILKLWPLRRGVCEFCVKYTMQTRERHTVFSDRPLAEYHSFNRRKNIATVPKVSTITSFLKAWGSSCH